MDLLGLKIAMKALRACVQLLVILISTNLTNGEWNAEYISIRNKTYPMNLRLWTSMSKRAEGHIGIIGNTGQMIGSFSGNLSKEAIVLEKTKTNSCLFYTKTVVRKHTWMKL